MTMINFNLKDRKNTMNRAIALAILSGSLGMGVATSGNAFADGNKQPSIQQGFTSNRNGGQQGFAPGVRGGQPFGAIQNQRVQQALSNLVQNGTITQTQSNAIQSAITAIATPTVNAYADTRTVTTLPSTRPTIAPIIGRELPQVRSLINNSASNAILTSTLGLTQAQIEAGLKTGKSLADLAGTNTSALITALVANDTKTINAAVAAGKLTPAAAAKQIANLTTIVTAEVNLKP